MFKENSMAATNNLHKAHPSFEGFLTSFIGELASDHFSTDGCLVSYLATPDINRIGDEANIVDLRITKSLLSALGYASKEIDYNDQKDALRPDYAIKIAEHPCPACFIVEDKSSTTLNLRLHHPQLQAYMTQAAAPCGILINGHSILVYDQLEGGLQTPAIELPLADTVLAWRGEHLFALGKTGLAALAECGVISLLAALWRRFKRQSFAGLQTLIDDLTLQSANGNNAPHPMDGTTWIPSLCRIAIVKIDSDNAELLTQAIKGLIAGYSGRS